MEPRVETSSTVDLGGGTGLRPGLVCEFPVYLYVAMALRWFAC